jgi:hypothetical protein
MMIRTTVTAFALGLWFAHPVFAAPADDEFFEKQVRPLLNERCQECHGAKKPRGGLRLTSRAHVLRGGDSGPAAVVGKPDDSLLVRAVRYTDTLRMPPKERLSDKEVAVLTRWVQIGMPWPESGTTVVSGNKFTITDEQRRFWSFQPIKDVKPPTVKDVKWAKSDLDRFILAALEAKGLHPARAADRRTLLRRATFDLIGLPPTADEIDAFLKDDSPDAFARVVDRLLASPAYGERWGRHWLDLVRYADSFDARGLGSEGDISEAWRYRDWVVNAFNRDLSYDKFILEQIAGDVAHGKPNADRDGVIATSMLAIGNWGGGDADKEKLLTDIADDQVDVVSRTFLGLTVACARCHDHKFDPISTADYYGLAGIFFSTHILPDVGAKTSGPLMLRIPLATAEEKAERERVLARIAEKEKELKNAREKAYQDYARSQLGQTARYLLAAHDYRHRTTDQAKMSVDAFADKQGLSGPALRRWLDQLGGGEYRLMHKPMSDVLGKKGVHGWHGDRDPPSLLANTTDREVTILTFKLPPKSVAVHPGPSNGVVVAWRSPVAGTVSVRGGVIDADPQGGDGIAWAIDLRRAGSWQELASGDIPNGGAQRFDKGKGIERLSRIEVKAGDRLDLVVLPKKDYICDTTTIDFVIALADGSKVWDLTRDLIDDIHQGNPHADRDGNAGVWSFLDMAEAKRGISIDPVLTTWVKMAASADAKNDRRALEGAAGTAQKAYTRTDARSPFYIVDTAEEKYLSAETRTALAKLTAEVAELKKRPLSAITFANGAQEGGVPGSPHAGVHDVRIHNRGRYDRLGDMVPRRFPEILAGTQQKRIDSGSGRLELARWLTGPDNPLTARVMVNRIWQYHFGTGIVRTPSNYGKLGERPTHPELLDHLARKFIQSGWSIKQMHRYLTLSATYQQASEPDAETLKADPDNRLFGRMNRRRLEAEAVRDSLLAVAGTLDRKLGGPAYRDFNTPRRTLYYMTVRSDRSGFGPLFDSADPTALVDRRTISTVAPQALFLLNNPFAVAQGKSLAKRLLANAKEDKDRIERGYVLLYGRPPTEKEVAVGLAFLKDAGANGKAWEEYAQLLLCANEFLYVD